MAFKDLEKWLASIGISKGLQEKIYCTLAIDDFHSAVQLMADLEQKGFALAFIKQVMEKWDSNCQSTFDAELQEKLKDPEFKKLFTEERERLRQGRK